MEALSVDEVGRVYLPQLVREWLGVQPGGRLVIEILPSGEVLVKLVRETGDGPLQERLFD